MKKKFYFATLVIAALSFTGCANDEYVGDQQNPGEQNGAIAFSTKSTNTVRATSGGPNAADKLNKQFWVYGTKKVGKENKPVFNNYRVYYTGNTNDPYSPKGWEYVGQQVAPAQAQTIKYWDYSASQYDFEAYSKTTGSVARNDAGDYEVTQLSSPKDLYFAEKKTVTKSNNNYKDAVQLTFKSVLSKIRVGFYETIPGYSVKIDRFYKPNEGATGFDDGNPVKDNFVAWCPNKKIEGNNNSFVVSYDGTTPAVTKVKKDDDYQDISTAGSPGGYTLNPELELGYHLLYSRNGSKNIGDSYSNVTWDQYEVNDGPSKYTYVIPQDGLYNSSEENSQVKAMKIKVDYTLTSTDGTDEPINVKGATAIVPAEYLSWKANTAYSYVFKISDNTNGTTGGEGDPAGLYPITFDAFVADYANGNEEFLTTVSELSVTATQNDTFFDPDKAVFKTNKAIKLKVMQNGTEVSNYTLTAYYLDDYKYEESFDTNVNGKTEEGITTLGELPTKSTQGYYALKIVVGPTTTYVVLKVDAST